MNISCVCWYIFGHALLNLALLLIDCLITFHVDDSRLFHRDWWGRISLYLRKENYLTLLLSNIFAMIFCLLIFCGFHTSLDKPLTLALKKQQQKFFNTEKYFRNNLISTRSRFGRSQQLWQSSIFFLFKSCQLRIIHHSTLGGVKIL